jgi:hypothetical protein
MVRLGSFGFGSDWQEVCTGGEWNGGKGGD